MRNANDTQYSTIMARLQEWAAWLTTTADKLKNDQEISAWEGVQSLHGPSVNKLVNDKGVCKAVRLLCEYGLSEQTEQNVNTLKHFFVQASTAHLFESKKSIQKTVSRSELGKELTSMSSSAKKLAFSLRYLDKRVPANRLQINHLSSKLKTGLQDQDVARVSDSHQDATALRVTSPSMASLLIALSDELNDQATKIKQKISTVGRQINGKSKAQSQLAKALLKITDKLVITSDNKRTKPKQQLVHAVLTCLWGSDAINRTYITKIASAMKSHANTV